MSTNLESWRRSKWNESVDSFVDVVVFPQREVTEWDSVSVTFLVELVETSRWRVSESLVTRQEALNAIVAATTFSLPTIPWVHTSVRFRFLECLAVLAACSMYETVSKWKFMHTLPTPKGANRKSKIPIGKGLQLRTKVVLGVVSYPTGMSHPSSPKNEFSGSKPIAHQRFPAKRSKTLARQRAREADVKFSAALLRQRSQSFATFTVGERKRVPPFVVGLAGSCKHETE